jgi:carbonic anhydrase
MKLVELIFLSLLFSLIFTLDYSAQETWGDDCQLDSIQSPININEKDVVDDNSIFSFESIDYKTIESTSVTYINDFSISTPTLDNGNITVKINGTIFTYKILNIHFHLNSEHTINGKNYDMEMHIVHENTNTEDKNNLHMLIAYIFEIDDDDDDDEEKSFLDSIGFNTGEEVKNVNVQDIVKKEDVYYYKGSLTTPPCTEDVNWVVIEDIKKMSQNQFDKFEEYVNKLNKNYSKGNNRKTFELNGRKVYKSEINDDDSDSFYDSDSDFDSDSYESDSDSNVFIKFSMSLFYLILILF